MIQVYAKVGQREEAEAWMQKLHIAAGGPSIQAYGALMDMYAARGQYAEAESLLEKVRASGLRLNRVLFNTAIKARANAGDVAGAEHWFKVLQTEGHIPDKYSYNTLFYSLVRDGQLSRAEQLIEQMVVAGLEPDDMLRRALERASNVERAVCRDTSQAETPEGVDWLEDRATDGGRLFRRAGTSETQKDPPSGGWVQLRSEHGPYFWNVATNVTSWEPPKIA